MSKRMDYQLMYYYQKYIDLKYFLLEFLAHFQIRTDHFRIYIFLYKKHYLLIIITLFCIQQDMNDSFVKFINQSIATDFYELIHHLHL